MRAFLFFLWSKIAAVIERLLNPEVAAKAEQLATDTKAAEKSEAITLEQIRETDTAIVAGQGQVIALGKERSETKVLEAATDEDIRKLELQRRQLREIEGTRFLVDNRIPDDVLTKPLPGAKPD